MGRKSSHFSITESADEHRRNHPVGRQEAQRRPEWNATDHKRKSIYAGSGVVVDRQRTPAAKSRSKSKSPTGRFHFVASSTLDYGKHVDLDSADLNSEAGSVLEEDNLLPRERDDDPEFSMANTSVDVKELPAAYVFVADVPGLKNSDIKVQIENDSILKISGERKREDSPAHDVKYVRVERAVGKFLRKFNLPANANLEGVTAACQDGLLTVTVPKVPPPEAHRPKTFDIAVGSANVAAKK